MIFRAALPKSEIDKTECFPRRRRRLPPASSPCKDMLLLLGVVHVYNLWRERKEALHKTHD